MGVALAMLAWAGVAAGAADPSSAGDAAREYAAHVRPMMTQYCLSCHSHKAKKGDLDLERFATVDEVRKDPRPGRTCWRSWKAARCRPEKPSRNPRPTSASG